MKHYVVVLRDSDGWVIGPFASSDEAGAWANAHWMPLHAPHSKEAKI